MRILIVILIAVITFSVACKKEPDQVNYVEDADPNDLNKPVIHIDDKEILEYFASYKNNSWWIYEEETTKERDSIFIQSKDQAAIVPHKLADKNTERISYILEWQKLQPLYLWVESTLTQDIYSVRFMYKNYGEMGVLIKDNGLFRTKDTINNSVRILDSMKVNDFNFYAVLEIRIAGEILYYAKNVGIISRRPSGSLKVFSLNKYYIN